jgi:guanine nucleotide-binding protein G(i) subunit alpha
MGAINAIEAADAQAPLDEELAAHVNKAWADPGVQETWGQRSAFQIIQSNVEFIADVDRLAAPDYVPSTADMLRCRVRTSGIVEEQFLISGVTFKVYDVGGQRNERKKWIHCFEGVTAVIFVAAISEYDQTLFEMEGVNRMVEAIELFDDIANSPFFLDSSMILFLNKRDLFAEKIHKVPIASQKPFADFSGAPGDYDAGADYFKRKFTEQMKDPDKSLFSHVTCALDTANVRVVFDSCNETIMRQNLASSGFM